MLCLGLSFALTLLYLLCGDALLTLFGGRVNPEAFAHAKTYFFWIAIGIPFYMFGQALNPIIRSDGSPRFAMMSTLAGAAVDVILDPIFIFGCHWGMAGAAIATVLGQILTAFLAVWYLFYTKNNACREKASVFAGTLHGRFFRSVYAVFWHRFLWWRLWQPSII